MRTNQIQRATYLCNFLASAAADYYRFSIADYAYANLYQDLAADRSEPALIFRIMLVRGCDEATATRLLAAEDQPT